MPSVSAPTAILKGRLLYHTLWPETMKEPLGRFMPVGADLDRPFLCTEKTVTAPRPFVHALEFAAANSAASFLVCSKGSALPDLMTVKAAPFMSAWKHHSSGSA